jgi:hypothetical protein
MRSSTYLLALSTFSTIRHRKLNIGHSPSHKSSDALDLATSQPLVGMRSLCWEAMWNSSWVSGPITTAGRRNIKSQELKQCRNIESGIMTLFSIILADISPNRGLKSLPFPVLNPYNWVLSQGPARTDNKLSGDSDEPFDNSSRQHVL